MQEKKIRQIYGWILTAVLILAGVCLMYACWQVYSTGGDHPYTAKRVAEAFAPIQIPVYLALALCVGSLFLPSKPEKCKMEKNYPLMLEKLHQKNDFTLCGDERLVCAIRREQIKRKRNAWIGWALLAVGSLIFLWYSLQKENIYAPESHATVKLMIRAMLVMLPCMGIPFGFGIYAAYAHKASIRKEWELMKLVAVPCEKPVPAIKVRKWMPWLQVGTLVLAVALIVIGYIGDGQLGVLAKAVEICKECVGIG